MKKSATKNSYYRGLLLGLGRPTRYSDIRFWLSANKDYQL